MPEQFLRKAEEGSTKRKKNSESDGAVDEARSAESGEEGEKYYTFEDMGNGTFKEVEHFRNNVTGNKKDKTEKRKSFNLKQKLPLLMAGCMLVIIIAFISIAQSILPVAVVSRMIEEFNTAGYTAVLRSDNILNYQMSSVGTSFGLTQYQKDSFKNYDVLPVDEGGGTVLAYETNEAGVWRVAHGEVPASPNIDKIKRLLVELYSDYGYRFDTLSLVTLEEAMDDGYFKNAYTAASKTWRGGNAGWYDTLSSLNEEIRGYTRTRFWYTVTDTVNSNLASTTKALNYRKSRKFNLSVTATAKRKINQFIVKTMAGTKLGKALMNKPVNMTKDRVAMGRLGLEASALLGYVSSGISLGCAGMQMISKAQTIISSIQNLQYLNLASGMGEAIQGAQVGNNDGEAMHTYMEALTKNDESGHNGMESEGMSAVMTGSEINDNAESVKQVNSERAMTGIDTSTSSGNLIVDTLRSFAVEMTDMLSAINTCRKVAAGLSILSTVATVAITVLTYGAGALVDTFLTSLISSVASLAIQESLKPLANAIIDWIWDSFSDTIAQNVATDWVGPPLGEATYVGFNGILTSQGLIGSSTLGGKEEAKGYLRERDRIIAEEAEYQRSVRSPFDVGSPYTFLGSIVYSLIPIATTSNAGGIIKSISSVMNDSISKIIPTASAVAETKIVTGFGDCPALEDIGAACDKLGRPYIISDESALKSYEPQELVDKVYALGGITSKTPTSSGTYEVTKDSNAEKFLTYCGERLSEFGKADANISEMEAQRARKNHWWASIPILGSLIESIITIFKDDTEERAWIMGNYCVYSEANSCFWESEGKYYQAFFQDQRILENSGAIEKSAATIALERYHDEYPIDNSAEGILARYSGMTKDDVIATLDFMEAMDYVANYKPEERIAFGVETIDNTIFFEETTDEFSGFIAVEPKYIIYDTIRNRATLV